jgi:hypothetical protein
MNRTTKNLQFHIASLILCMLVFLACSEQGNYTAVSHKGAYVFGVWQAHTAKVAEEFAHHISQSVAASSASIEPLPIITIANPTDLLPIDGEVSHWVRSWQLALRLSLEFEVEFGKGGTPPSSALRQAFHSKGMPLSEYAIISTEKRGVPSAAKWLIIDEANQQMYAIKKEETTLKVYWREPSTYTGKNLYKNVIGEEPELYHSYGFIGQANIEYQTPRFSSRPLIFVEIFDMGNLENAFGIYSFSRYPKDKFEWVGSRAYISSDTLGFWKGKYFIRIREYEFATGIRAGMFDLAKAIASRIKDRPAKPHILKLLPQKGRMPNSEKYFFSNSALRKIYRFLPKDGLQLSTNAVGIAASYPHGSAPKEWLDMMIVFVIRYPRESEAKVAYEAYRAHLLTHAITTQPIETIETEGIIASMMNDTDR